MWLHNVAETKVSRSFPHGSALEHLISMTSKLSTLKPKAGRNRSNPSTCACPSVAVNAVKFFWFFEKPHGRQSIGKGSSTGAYSVLLRLLGCASPKVSISLVIANVSLFLLSLFHPLQISSLLAVNAKEGGFEQVAKKLARRFVTRERRIKSYREEINDLCSGCISPAPGSGAPLSRVCRLF